MLKNVLILPDGTELSSGAGNTNAIKSVAVTECVNSGEELTIGSVCAKMLEVTAITPNGGVDLTAGDIVELRKEDTDSGGAVMHYIGAFTLEKPTRPTANTMKLTGYDAVAKLDKDLTAWLASLTGWPYNILTFAGMVCKACGLEFVSATCPNSDYMVKQFTAQATGRKLMGWLAEICCRFCRATPYGAIEFGWYAPAGISLAPSGEHYYFQNGLAYETYATAQINAVQLRLADSEDGALYPQAEDGANSYIISGNPILLSNVTESTLAVLENIKNELAKVSYTPCKVSIPASMAIRAGHTVQITDKNGKTITAYVMTKTQKGQRDTLECTGSQRRDSSAAANNRPVGDVAQEAVKSAFSGLTHTQIFNKLTDNGKIQGIYVQDSKWYINAQYAQIINLKAESITAGKLSSVDGKSYFDLTAGKIVTNNITATGGTIGGCSIVNGKLEVPAANITGTLSASQVNADNLKVKAANITGTLTAAQINTQGLIAENISSTTLEGKTIKGGSISIGESFSVSNAGVLNCSSANISGVLTAGVGSSLGGFKVDGNSLYKGSWGSGAPSVFMCTGSSGTYTLGGHSGSGWVFGAGSKFGVTNTGNLYCSGGTIGGWTINSSYLSGNSGEHIVRLYPSGYTYGSTKYFLVVFDSGGANPVGGICASGWKSI